MNKFSLSTVSLIAGTIVSIFALDASADRIYKLSTDQKKDRTVMAALQQAGILIRRGLGRRFGREACG
ncbi:MAG: hypothetical protein V4692_04755, partial [Bdellovibrionota bacterium]